LGIDVGRSFFQRGKIHHGAGKRVTPDRTSFFKDQDTGLLAGAGREVGEMNGGREAATPPPTIRMSVSTISSFDISKKRSLALVLLLILRVRSTSTLTPKIKLRTALERKF